MVSLTAVGVLLLVAQVVAVYNASYNGGAFWRLNCHGRSVFQGRADNIVSAGSASGHVHKVFGGNAFSGGQVNDDPLLVYKKMRQSTCTSCSVQKADLSNYWHPELYYRDPKTDQLSVVAGEGIIAYYFSNPNTVAFPPGLRMISGDSARRSFNSSDVKQTAISYVCLGTTKPWTDNGAGFPTKDNFCGNIMRAQIYFPQCWDGKNLDSADHKSHMSFPVGGDQRYGNCPASHPVRVPVMFWEVIYNTGWYPHGDGVNRFMWANGDTTGFGFHADFMNGWDQKILQMAIQDTTCGGDGEIAHCDTFKPYLGEPSCTLLTPITVTEDIGMAAPIKKLPGCNPPSGGPASFVSPCSTIPKQSTGLSSMETVVFRSKKNGGYLTAPHDWTWAALTTPAMAVLDSTWNIYRYSTGHVGLRNAGNANYVINWNYGTAIARSDSAEKNTWAEVMIVPQNASLVAIQSIKDGTWLKIQDDGSANYNQWGNPTADCLFTMTAPDGGSIIAGGDPILADNISKKPNLL